MAREKGGPHYVWGICTNLDKDGNGNPCPNCKSKEKLKLSIRDEFVCPECGEPLTKVKGSTGPDFKKIGIIAAAVLLVAGIGYGIYAVVSGMGGSKINNIKLDKKELTLKVGERELLTAIQDPVEAKASFIWKSSDKSVVDVVGGELTALKKGKATIIVKVEENAELPAATCKVEVKGVENVTKETFITSLSINSSDFTLKVGESKVLAYQAMPEQNDEKVSWSTSDPKVATVSASGEVKAIGVGTATVIVLSDKSAKEANIKVTVQKKDTPGGYNGTRNLGYATFDGTTMTFTKRHVIPGTNQTANPGDKVTGKWINGEVNLVRWYHDGTSEPLTHK